MWYCGFDLAHSSKWSRDQAKWGQMTKHVQKCSKKRRRMQKLKVKLPLDNFVKLWRAVSINSVRTFLCHWMWCHNSGWKFGCSHVCYTLKRAKCTSISYSKNKWGLNCSTRENNGYFLTMEDSYIVDDCLLFKLLSSLASRSCWKEVFSMKVYLLTV